MKPFRILPFIILCATATVFSQDLVLQGRTPPVAASAWGTIAGDCPVGLQVDHGSWFARREVADVSKPGLQQHLHLTLTNLRQRKIVSAQLTVHGLSQKSRFLEVARPEPDMVKRIGLSLEIDGNGQRSSDLSLNRFAVVMAVDVNAVTYADGSIWRELTQAACRVTPSTLMRVSNAP